MPTSRSAGEVSAMLFANVSSREPPGIVSVACRALKVESGERLLSRGSRCCAVNLALRTGDREGDRECARR